MMKLFRARGNQAGAGLIEIMVALTISTLLMTGLIEVVVGNKETYRLQESLSRLQENGRFALDYLTRDIRNAGFLGCGGSSSVRNTLNNNTSYAWNFSNIVEGFEATSSTNWNKSPSTIAGITDALGGRDILSVRHMVGTPVHTISHASANPPGSAEITVAINNGLKQHDIVMVSDCFNSAIFQITSASPNTSGSLAHVTASGTPGNATTELGKEYTPVTGAEVVKILTDTYYVASGTNGLPALFRKQANNTPVEIIEGVENIQVSFGLDTDGDKVANRYSKADSITDWTQVCSIDISLLLVSLEDYLAETPQPYVFDGISYDGGTGTGKGPLPIDTRIRRVFNTSVSLRNRTL